MDPTAKIESWLPRLFFVCFLALSSLSLGLVSNPQSKPLAESSFVSLAGIPPFFDRLFFSLSRFCLFVCKRLIFCGTLPREFLKIVSLGDSFFVLFPFDGFDAATGLCFSSTIGKTPPARGGARWTPSSSSGGRGWSGETR